jgi:hypothetical protein
MAQPRRTILTGAIVMVGALAMILSPFALGANDVSKTVVAFGLLVFLAGASFLLHGTWDWIARR